MSFDEVKKQPSSHDVSFTLALASDRSWCA